MTNIFYQEHLLTIGGVETFLYELARLCYDNGRDLTIIYKTGDPEQISRIKQFCNCVPYKSLEKPIKCKRAFFNYRIDCIDEIEAEEYIQLVHADFKDKSLKGYSVIQSDKINKYYAVSKNNAKSFRELTGKDIGVLYNPITIDEQPKIMTLVSAQRFTIEKGGKRVIKLIQELDKARIPYVWHIFSTIKLDIDSENIVQHKPTLDIRKWISYADYTVLLSDTEGFSYTAYESLCLGTPLIITRLPILSELGADENNSIVLDFDMSNLDVNEIYNKAGNFKFKYNGVKTDWLKMLPDKGSYTPPACVTIKAIKPYFDTVLNCSIKKSEIVSNVEIDRAKKIVDAGLAVYIN